MYNNFAKHYDKLFPLDSQKVDFFKKLSDNIEYPKTLLDIGCATGNLAFSLEDKFNGISAIDFDHQMIETATIKNEHHHVDFRQMNMMNISSSYFDNSMSVVSCLGNTIVHLSSELEISEFIRQAKKLLRANGIIIIQLLNYDNIIKNNIQKLPLIETDEFVFTREYDKVGEKLDFHTSFTVKKTNETKGSAVKLLPIKFEQLKKILTNNGFNKVEAYSNWKKDKFQEDSFQLIIEAS